jgi:hypothetical protein
LSKARGTDSVQSHHDLLVDRFDRDGEGEDAFVPVSFKKGLGIISICLVALYVGADCM